MNPFCGCAPPLPTGYLVVARPRSHPWQVLRNVPGLDDSFQQRAFRVVREFFGAEETVKLSADIRASPYFRGWSRATDLGRAPPTNAHGEPRFAQVIEAYQYAFDQPAVAAHDDSTVPIHRRVFRGASCASPAALLSSQRVILSRTRAWLPPYSSSHCSVPASCICTPGPNTWPDSNALPGFRPLVQELTAAYHSLTHELGHLICESLGEDPASFDAVRADTALSARRWPFLRPAPHVDTAFSAPPHSRRRVSRTQVFDADI